MSRRATMRQGDLNRLVKAAKLNGMVVAFDGETYRVLPTHPEASSTLPDSDTGEAEWDKALGLQ